MTAKKMAHPIPEFRAARQPPRTARALPVKKPAMTEERQISHETRIKDARMLYSEAESEQVDRRTRVIRILLLPYALDGAVKRRE